MWPSLVDYSDEECKRALRSLELEAYSSIVNAFRAQGTLTRDRKKMLQELSSALSISMERHRSEVRRAINDEHLSTVAERLSGPNTVTDWAIEGRRVVPLMQRLAPQTAFTEIANTAATAQAAKNASLQLPGKTGEREVLNGVETMASRKRKDPSPLDPMVSPRKIAAMDPQYFHSTTSTFSGTIQETTTTADVSISYESCNSPEITASSYSDSHSSKTITATIMASMSQTSSSRHSTSKTTPATTLSSFDQLTSNLLASRAASKTYLPAVLHEEQVSSMICDPTKPSTSDLKTAHRPLSSHTTVKSSSNVIMTPSLSSSSVSSSSSSSSKERMQTLPCTSLTNKFLSQIRSKNPGHARQNLPAGLGQKLSPQSHVNQRATIPQKSPIKSKDNSASIFKKTSSSPVSENQSSSNESITIIPKSPVNKPKTDTLNAKPQAAAAKNLPKTTQHNSQYISRSLFSTSTNKSVGTSKSLSPVIFNVSTASSTALQSAPKMTGTAPSEMGKTTQLVTKTSSVGMGVSHVKINTSNAQTFQYRNDGGVVRSARIVNISQPVGTRLPCTISPSAISALGLPANALRVSVPAGTLSSSSSIRVSTAQKPNVIVVHKAQVYQRPSQQGSGAVIMTSAPMSKVSNDIAQEIHTITYKQDKNKASGSKTSSRTLTSIRPQSPAVSVASDKTSDAQCKKNLLADIMEASGILLENTARKNALLKEKNNAVKNNKEFSNHQDIEIISQKGPALSNETTTPARLSESNTSKTESANNSSGSTALTVASVERNGVDTQKQGTPQAQSVESQSKDTCNTVVSPLHITNDNVTNSSECGSKGNQELTKEKDS